MVDNPNEPGSRSSDDDSDCTNRDDSSHEANGRRSGAPNLDPAGSSEKRHHSKGSRRSGARSKSRSSKTGARWKPKTSASAKQKPLPGEPLIVSRENHRLSRKLIDPDALKVMYRLLRHGYRAFLVGGGVRDLLLGRRPKDFDVGTDARPNEIRSLFRNSRIIGRRFRLVHVYFRGQKVIEVSTLRRSAEASADGEVPLLASDNTYGDAETDALRRDLTINGLFYDLSSFSIIDYVGGMSDLENGIVRIIGDPDVRIREDPVRMLRAIRHASKARFTIEPVTYQSIKDNASSIALCPRARISEEFLRELRYGSTAASFKMFEDSGLLPHLIPPLSKTLGNDIGNDSGSSRQALYSALTKLDESVAAGEEYSPAVLYAALFIGVCSPEKLGIGGSRIARETQEYAWSSRPFCDYETPANGDARPVRSYIAAARQGALKRTIDEWFRPLGVSRKERERMEQLLTSRLLMFGEYYGQGKTTGLLQKSYFKDTLSLVGLTASDDEARGCWEYWNLRAKKQTTSKSSSSGSQKRKHRRTSGRGRKRKSRVPG